VVALSVGVPVLAPGRSGAAGPGLVRAIPPKAYQRTDALTRADFAPLVGSRFRFRTPDGRRVTAVLAAVSDRRPSRDVRGECFALRFRARAARAMLAQDTYGVQHDALGTFALFIVPMGAERGRAYYEAVVNRVHG
jgi:hypothetical protein